MKDLIITCNSEEEQLSIVTILLTLGVKHFKGLKVPQGIVDTTYNPYPHIVVRGYNKTFCGICHHGSSKRFEVLSFEDDLPKIIERIQNLNKKIKISDVGEFEAVVTEKNVTVGCQTITHEKVLEIADAIERIKDL